MEIVIGIGLSALSIFAGKQLHSDIYMERTAAIAFGIGIVAIKSVEDSEKNMSKVYIDTALASFTLGAIFGSILKSDP